MGPRSTGAYGGVLSFGGVAGGDAARGGADVCAGAQDLCEECDGTMAWGDVVNFSRAVHFSGEECVG